MPKPKLPTTVTPKGIAAYAWIAKPDDKFGEPVYKITLVLDDTEEVREYVETLDQLGAESARILGHKLKKSSRKPWEVYDYDPEEEGSKEEWDGKIIIKAKSKYRPGQFDAKRNELPEDVFVMSGDVVRFSAIVTSYDGLGGGYSLRLRNVQLIEKRHSVGSTGSEFDVEEDGFDASAVVRRSDDRVDDEDDF